MPLFTENKKEIISITLFSVTIGILILSLLLFPEKEIRASSSPTVNSVMISENSAGGPVASINLLENSTKNIYIYGTFGDQDGCGDVKTGGSLKVAFYRSTVSTTSECGANNLYCYRGSYATSQCLIWNCDEGTELTANYECTLPLQYYADATDVGLYLDANWTAYVEAKDAAETSGVLTSSTEVNTLAAIEIGGALTYGTLNLGTTSTQEQVMITNTGNTTVDLQMIGRDMSCGTGMIPAGQQHYTTVSGTLYEDMSVLPTSTTNVDLNLLKFNLTESTTTLYFQLKMPNFGAGGSCSGVNSLSAIPN